MQLYHDIYLVLNNTVNVIAYILMYVFGFPDVLVLSHFESEVRDPVVDVDPESRILVMHK